VLMANFKLTAQQADAILDLKLRHLAKLEEVKIKAEQQELSKERDTLVATLKSEKRLTTLIKKELTADIKNFGDARRSPITIRETAKVLKQVTKIPSDPMTIILSNKGWIRAGKGHEVDPTTLNYKSGDEYKAHAYGYSNKMAVFLDSFGRAYTVAIHTMPSVRGYGEPLTSRVTPVAGAVFEALLTGADNSKFLLLSSAGYGFCIVFESLLAKNRKGKLIMNLANAATLLQPIYFPVAEELSGYKVALVSSDGRLLVYSLLEIPELAKGKGKKLISLPQDIKLITAAIIPPKKTILIKAARRKLALAPKELKHYIGEIGQRGKALPKGVQKVQNIIVQ